MKTTLRQLLAVLHYAAGTVTAALCVIAAASVPQAYADRVRESEDFELLVFWASVCGISTAVILLLGRGWRASDPTVVHRIGAGAAAIGFLMLFFAFARSPDRFDRLMAWGSLALAVSGGALLLRAFVRGRGREVR